MPTTGDSDFLISAFSVHSILFLPSLHHQVTWNMNSKWNLYTCDLMTCVSHCYNFHNWRDIEYQESIDSPIFLVSGWWTERPVPLVRWEIRELYTTAVHTLKIHTPCQILYSLSFGSRSKTHKRLKERFLIRWNRTKRANFRGKPLFQARYCVAQLPDVSSHRQDRTLSPSAWD